MKKIIRGNWAKLTPVQSVDVAESISSAYLIQGLPTNSDAAKASPVQLVQSAADVSADLDPSVLLQRHLAQPSSYYAAQTGFLKAVASPDKVNTKLPTQQNHAKAVAQRIQKMVPAARTRASALTPHFSQLELPKSLSSQPPISRELMRPSRIEQTAQTSRTVSQSHSFLSDTTAETAQARFNSTSAMLSVGFYKFRQAGLFGLGMGLRQLHSDMDEWDALGMIPYAIQATLYYTAISFAFQFVPNPHRMMLLGSIGLCIAADDLYHNPIEDWILHPMSAVTGPAFDGFITVAWAISTSVWNPEEDSEKSAYSAYRR